MPSRSALLYDQTSASASDRLELIRLIQEGLSFDEVEQAAAAAGVTVTDLAAFGTIPARTLSHSRRMGRFSPAQSDRVSRFLRVWSHARETFGSVEKARAWMTRPTRVFGGRPPAELLDTDEGARLVDETLGRIEHGIAA